MISSKSGSRSRSGSKSRDRDDDGYEVAGEKEKKKKEDRRKRQAEKKQGEQDKKAKKSNHREGGTFRERQAVKGQKMRQGFLNTVKNDAGESSRVPLYKPPTLAKGKSVDEIRHKQEKFRKTFAQITAANKASTSGDTNIHLQEVRVFKTDRSALTREDQWRIQFSITGAILQATKDGKQGADIAHSGTRLEHHQLVVNANNISGAFYKNAINSLEGFEAFLPHEWPNANKIFCHLPGAAEVVIPELAAHFAAGTFGAIKQNQVRVPKLAWKPPGNTTSFRVFLEVDDEAFAWLKERNWQSFIGLHMIRWQHPPVTGLNGYIAPDQDIELLLNQLGGGSSSRITDPPANIHPNIPQVQAHSSASNIPQEQVHLSTTNIPQEHIGAPNTRFEANKVDRDRHLTGCSDKEQQEQEQEKALIRSELHCFTEDLTEQAERELLEITLMPADKGNNKTSTPVSERKKKKKKGHRSRKRSRSSLMGSDEDDQPDSSASSVSSADEEVESEGLSTPE